MNFPPPPFRFKIKHLLLVLASSLHKWFHSDCGGGGFKFMMGVFLNGWWVAVGILHNKKMEFSNNPTPEVVLELVEWTSRVKKMQKWSSKRWSESRVAKEIYEREHSTLQ